MERFIKPIESINYDAKLFLAAFKRFRNNFTVIDDSLCTNLLRIVTEIDDFLDSKPKEVTVPKNVQLTSTDFVKPGILKVFHCQQCEKPIGDSFETARAHLKCGRHFNSKEERNENKDSSRNYKSNLVNKVLPKNAKSLLLCDLQQLLTVNLNVSTQLLDLPEYSVIENDLLKLIRPAFPNDPVKLYFFGSRISGIGSIYSDLDIFVDIGKVFHNFENRASDETMKKLKVVRALLTGSPKWKRLISIENARVPILRVFNKQTCTYCDIGFSNSLGYCNTKLMKYIFELQPIVKALCLFMKKWLERSKLSERVTSYRIVLMVIYYFQEKKQLPSIKTLQDDLTDAIPIGPWLATFTEKSLADLNIPVVVNSVDNFKRELKQFFTFYSTFDFENNLICPYLGCKIPMADLETSPLLPQYTKYIETDKETKDTAFKKSFMNVQDPFQMNHNVTRAVPQTTVLLLKHYYELSADAITITEPPASKLDEENSKDLDNKDNNLKK